MATCIVRFYSFRHTSADLITCSNYVQNISCSFCRIETSKYLVALEQRAHCEEIGGVVFCCFAFSLSLSFSEQPGENPTVELEGQGVSSVEVLFPFARLSGGSQSLPRDLFNVFRPRRAQKHQRRGSGPRSFPFPVLFLLLFAFTVVQTEGLLSVPAFHFLCPPSSSGSHCGLR